MKEHAMYFGKSDIYDKIRTIGGAWNDSKERPIVCLVESNEHKGIFWAIPVGDWEHRDKKAQERIQSFIDRDASSISSCYYHVGNTTTKSIFFISDVIPITSQYIEREYIGHNGNGYVIKNKVLLSELNRKLNRILAYEKANPNSFRQHITDLVDRLNHEMVSSK